MKPFQQVIAFLTVTHKALTEKNPPYSELITNYEEYHKNTHISQMSSTRLKLISEWIKPKSSILDVGCGETFTMEFLRNNKQCKVNGIDISSKCVANARDKGFECVQRDIEKEGLGLAPHKKYDHILFIEVLEHLKYPHKVLVDACKHVKKGVIATIPNTGYLYWRLQALRGFFPRQSFTHLHFWSINDFQLFLKQLNLKPLDHKTDLPTRGINSILTQPFKNLLAYQQCWLIAPKNTDATLNPKQVLSNKHTSILNHKKRGTNSIRVA